MKFKGKQDSKRNRATFHRSLTATSNVLVPNPYQLLERYISKASIISEEFENTLV